MQVGDEVPDFSARTDRGGTVRLSDLVQDGPVVLFFYPKAHTPGCTAESCRFRDLAAEFAAVGASRVGVSRDDPATQADFREQQDLDMPLIADEDGSVGAIFGAKRIGPLWHRRVTAVVGQDRRLLALIKSELDVERHADEALQVLRDAQDDAAA